MTNEECFELWAPRGVVWSQWAKPVLFAQLGRQSSGGGDPARGDFDVSWVPEPRRGTAVIVDLPGADSAAAGLALARRGYRPVPLYNTSLGPSPVVDAEPIARLLAPGAELLREAALPPDAPPAFLLDARRMRPTAAPTPGKFDNRWVVFPQDFPSGTHLLARGIGEVLLLHLGDTPQEDLAHILLRWRQAGLRIVGADARGAGRPRELTVRVPSMFRRAWHRAMALAGLRRNDAGGFGAVIPVPSAGGVG
jgi:hypothetical protein